MTGPRPRTRPPRIAASLHERRNDFRPTGPMIERLLHGLGAHPSFADAVIGDLAEERARREVEQGAVAARLWYAREALRAIPHLLGNALRHGGAGGRTRVAALLAGPALMAALVAAFMRRDLPPAYLVFEAQRGIEETNAVVLNGSQPVKLVTRAFDAKERELPPGGVQYRWVAGIPIPVSSSGIVTCTERGDAELRAWAGGVATRVIVHCRPVRALNGSLTMSLIVGERGRLLPITALRPNGYSEDLVAYEARVLDTGVAALKGLMVQPVAPGTTSAILKVGDGQTRIWVTVYEPVPTLDGLRPDQRLVSAPVRLARGDTIDWPLPTGRFWLRFTPATAAHPRPAPRIRVSGQITCTPSFGLTDQVTCIAPTAEARVRIAHPGTSRDSIVGNLALERRDP
jgi:hypothetical protein